MKRILKSAVAVILLACTLTSFTSCITIARYIISAYKENESDQEREELSDDSILTSSYAELPLHDYVFASADYSDVTISRAEIESFVEVDLMMILQENGISMPNPEAGEAEYTDAELNEFVVNFTEYESLNAFREEKYRECSMDLAYSRYVMTLEVHPPKEGGYLADNIVIEYLFHEFGLQLTYGEFKERITLDIDDSFTISGGTVMAPSESYDSEENTFEVIIGESDFTGSFAVIEVSDEQILEVERMMVQEELVRRVTFVD